MEKRYKEQLFKLSNGTNGVELYEELLKLTEIIITDTYNKTATDFIEQEYQQQTFFMNHINNTGWDTKKTKDIMMENLWSWGNQLVADVEKYDITLP